MLLKHKYNNNHKSSSNESQNICSLMLIFVRIMLAFGELIEDSLLYKVNSIIL